jgi:DNA-binding CsgD family transcriptional regulator
MRFNPEVWIHKESYVLVEELKKSQVSLNPFLSQVVTKTELELLTITKMGNINFTRLTTQSGSSTTTSNHLGAQLQE